MKGTMHCISEPVQYLCSIIIYCKTLVFFNVTCSIWFVFLVYLTGSWQSNQLQYTRICVWLWFSLCLYVGAIGINLFVEMTKVVRTALMMVTVQNTVLSGVHTVVW